MPALAYADAASRAMPYFHDLRFIADADTFSADAALLI